MKFVGIQKQADDFPVDWMCRRLSVSRSGFYDWLRRRREASKAQRSQAALLLRIKAVHTASRGTYGSPRVHRQLAAEGVQVGRKRVERLMREVGLFGRTRRKFVKTTTIDASRPPSENILGRIFAASGPNEKWVTDITYLPTDEGWLYLAMILDLYSNRVVGYALADHMKTSLALEALERAVTSRKPSVGLLHHSDRGSQYTSKEYQKALAAAGMVCSMSRKGECWDNACAESFFGRLKEELAHHKKWRTRAEAARDVTDYIENFYNVKRIQKRLGYACPVSYEFERMQLQRAA